MGFTRIKRILKNHKFLAQHSYAKNTIFLAEIKFLQYQRNMKNNFFFHQIEHKKDVELIQGILLYYDFFVNFF